MKAQDLTAAEVATAMGVSLRTVMRYLTESFPAVFLASLILLGVPNSHDLVLVPKTRALLSRQSHLR